MENKYPLYKELFDLYKKGELKPPDNEHKWLCFYSDKETQKLGNKYLFHTNWDELVKWFEWDKELEKRKLGFLWKIKLKNSK